MMRLHALISVIGAVGSAYALDDSAFAAAAYAEIVTEVGSVTIGNGAYPGYLQLSETRAFPLVMSGPVIVAAAGTYGDQNGGRVAGFGHSSFGSAVNSNIPASGLSRLLLNTVRWVGKKTQPKIAYQSGHSGSTTLANALKVVANISGTALTESSIRSGSLSNYDVFIGEAGTYSDSASQAAIRSFLVSGKGVIMIGTPWAYRSSAGFVLETAYAANNIFMGTGITFMGDFDWDFTFSPWSVPEVLPPQIRTNGMYAAEFLTQMANHSVSYNATVASTAYNTLVNVINYLYDVKVNFPNVFTQVDLLENLIRSKWNAAFTYPSQAVPFSMSSDAMLTLLISLETLHSQNLPAGDLVAHPAHVDFPGSVPEASARVTKVVRVYGDYIGYNTRLGYSAPEKARWRSTGLYLKAGEQVTVTIPSDLVSKGLTAVVGAHTDDLSKLDSIKRMPVISRTWSLSSATTVIGNSFGGLIYIGVPHRKSLGDFDVTIEGGHATILYEHGITTMSQWAAMLETPAANLPPWGELASSHFVLTLPTSVFHSIRDPVDLMDYWVQVVKEEDYLLSYPPASGNQSRAEKNRAERFTTDVQISAGWMHSGYPIMAYLSVSQDMVNKTYLMQNGNWGPYHEIGHNHQLSETIVPASTEVSVNWFTVFATERINKYPVIGATFEKDLCMDWVRQYLKSPSYTKLQDDPFMHLMFFMIPKSAFGWGMYLKMLDEYYRNSSMLSSFSSAKLVDPMIQRMSKAAGVSFVDWADAWKYPISQTTRNLLADLPKWDFEKAIDDIDVAHNPRDECYTPNGVKNTPVMTNDPELDPVLWHWSGYYGKVNKTKSGYTCQRWDAQTPNSHNYKPEKKPCMGLYDNNYCRMAGDVKPWCYTVNGPRWEYCDIPVCAKRTVSTDTPSAAPVYAPSIAPTKAPNVEPPSDPTVAPTTAPAAIQPTRKPVLKTSRPTKSPFLRTSRPTPTSRPSKAPTTNRPTSNPVMKPTKRPRNMLASE